MTGVVADRRGDESAGDELEREVKGIVVEFAESGGAAPADSLAAQTRLGADLGIASLGLVRLAARLQDRFGGRPLPFQELFVSADGTILQDIEIGRLIDFLARHVDER